MAMRLSDEAKANLIESHFPEVVLDVDLDAEVPCDIVDCEHPAHFRLRIRCHCGLPTMEEMQGPPIRSAALYCVPHAAHMARWIARHVRKKAIICASCECTIERGAIIWSEI